MLPRSFIDEVTASVGQLAPLKITMIHVHLSVPGFETVSAGLFHLEVGLFLITPIFSNIL